MTITIITAKEAKRLQTEVARLEKKVKEQRELLDQYQADIDPTPPVEYAWPSVPQIWFQLLSLPPSARHARLQFMLEAVQQMHSVEWWGYRVETTLQSLENTLAEGVDTLLATREGPLGSSPA